MRALPSGWRVLVAAVCGLALVLGGPVMSAAADPDPVQQAKQQLSKLDKESSEIDSAYAAAQAKLATSRKQLKTTQADVIRQEQQVKSTAKLVSRLALIEYRAAGADVTLQLFSSPNPDAFLNGLRVTGRVSANLNSTLQDYQAKAAGLTELRRSAAAEVITITAEEVKLKALAAKSDSKVAAAKALLARLTAAQRAQVEAADGGTTSRSTVRPPVVGSASGRAAQALAYATAQVGKPYVYGAEGPSAFDCSGLMMAAYASAGISLPRTSQDQFGVGTAVSRDQLQPGDLVFFYSGISHVGMYVGNGRIVHASNPRVGVIYGNVDSPWMPFAGARRVA